MKEKSQTQLAGLPIVLFSRDIHWTQEETEPRDGVLILLPPSYTEALAGAVGTGKEEEMASSGHTESATQEVPTQTPT